MYFSKINNVLTTCSKPADQIATIEIPLGIVDLTYLQDVVRLGDYSVRSQRRLAAHPSERGCFMTMPLVLCDEHQQEIFTRWSA